MPSKPSSSPPSPISRPGFSWEKIDALWAQHGVPFRPKVIMRKDPKTGKTVFTNTELVPELAPQQEETHWAAPTSSVPSVTQPPGNVTHPPEKSDAKGSTDEASSSFCEVPKSQPAPVFSGSQADFATSRPHTALSVEVVESPVSCINTEPPATPTTTGFDKPSTSVRPHSPSSSEGLTDEPEIANAMAVRSNDPPEVRLKKLALKIFQNGGSYKTVSGNLGISRDKARTWKRLWQIGRFEDNIRGIRFSGDYSAEIKAKVRERFRAGATAGELEKEFKIPRQTIRKWL